MFSSFAALFSSCLSFSGVLRFCFSIGKGPLFVYVLIGILRLKRGVKSIF